MQKALILLTVICALCANSLLAQPSCANFYVTPEFDTSDTVYVDVHERLSFRVFNDRSASFSNFILPPGYHVQGNSGNTTEILGEMQSPGTYEFRFVATSTENGCVDTVQFFRTYIESPTHICERMVLRSDWNSGSEHWVGSTIRMQFFVSEGAEDPPFTFYALDIPEGATFDSLGNYTDTPTAVEHYSFRVYAKDSFGCTSDTLTYDIFTMCPVPAPMRAQVMTTGTTGQAYEQQVAGEVFLLHPPFANFMTFNSLPPGLTLGSNGILSGTPTASGDYSFEVRYTGLGGCPAQSSITIRINQPVPVQSLWITPVCAQSLAERNWVVHNPNSFPINVEWRRVYAPVGFGSIVIQPGANNLSVPDGGWPNTIRISWFDQNNVSKSIVQAANDDLCSPPECAWVNGVTFYHQGRQRDGNPVQQSMSYDRGMIGPPDADDAPFRTFQSFSLGYNGFITMKLSANVYDQPGPDLTVWEWSLDNPDYAAYPERAEVFVSTDNANWISLGLTNPTADCHSKLDWDFDLAGKATWCRYVKVVDVTERWAFILDPVTCAPTNVRAFNDVSNGFDLDAVTCANYSPGNNVAGRMAGDETSIEAEFLFDATADDLSPVAYPNPATSVLTLDFTREPEFVYPETAQVEVSVIDMTGKINMSGIQILDNEWKTQVNVERLTAGVFVARVRTNGLTKYYKFMRN